MKFKVVKEVHYKFLLIKVIVLLILFNTWNIFAQADFDTQIGSPLIRNFTTKEYGSTAQNWSIVQNDNGILFFANTIGVIEYDGEFWKQIDIPNNVARSLALDKDGNVLVGGSNQFGYLTPDSLGRLRFISISDLLPDSLKNFGDIWSILVAGNGVYFQSVTEIFFCNYPLKDIRSIKDIKIWNASTRFNPGFIINGKVFIPERSRGLLTIDNDSLVVVLPNEKLASNNIYSMFPYPPDNHSNNTKYLIGSADKGFFIWDGKHISRFRTEADKYILEHNLYLRGATLKNNSYAIPTQTGGLVIFDEKGKLLKVINKNNGLADNTVWYVYPDNMGNIWLGLNNGIAKINYPSPISIIDQRNGLEGTIISMKRIGDLLYINSSDGLYVIDDDALANFPFRLKKIKGISVQTWDVLKVNDLLLIATSDGVMQSQRGNLKTITASWNLPYKLHRVKFNPNIILVALHTGLAKLVYKNGRIYDGGRVEGISSIVDGIQEAPDGTIWLQTFNDGVFRLNPANKNLVSGGFLVSHYSDNEGASSKYSRILIKGNTVLLGTDKGLKIYDQDKDRFIQYNDFGEDIADNSYMVKDIKSGEGNSLWILRGKGKEIELIKIGKDSKHEIVVEDHPVIKLILDSDLNFTETYILPDNKYKNLIWINNNDKLYLYDLNQMKLTNDKPEFNTLFKSIIVKGDSSVPLSEMNYGNNKNIYEQTLPFENNSITFQFTATNFIRENSVKYRYILEGFDSKWSDWGRELAKEYTNLSPGEYKFIVQSKDIFNNTGKEAVYSFRVLAPWYRTVWAFIIFGLFVVFIIWLIIRYRLNYLEKKTRKLELVVSQRTEEVVRQKEQLEKQAAKLLEMDQIKSNFFANISHEFRTPLTLIMGEIGSVLSSIKDKKLIEKLKTAGSNSLKLQRLINQLLDLSKLESGELKLKYQPIDVCSFLKTCVSAFESLAERKKIEIELRCDDGINNFYADYEKLEDIINNLLSNAIKFTGENKSIIISAKRSDEGIAGNNGSLIITIEDNGIGISEKDLKYIFDRFYQVDGTSTREQEGTGIGLALVKELVDKHNGSITVTSKKGEGSKFEIKLPLGKKHLKDEDIIEEPVKPEKLLLEIDDQTDAAEISDADLTNNKLMNNGGKELILIVEDNDDMRKYISEHLNNYYDILEAKNGNEGYLFAVEKIPDLILTDVMMPQMNGYEFTEKIRKDKNTSHIPVIMLTAKADEESKLKGLDLGVDDYLIKPFSTKELLVRVENLIKLRKMLKEKYKEISAINPLEINAKPIDQEFLEKVFENIKTHIEDPNYSVSVLSEEVGMSVSQLNRKLNALINQTAGKLIRATRLDYAAKMLEQNAVTVSEIGYRIGFSDAASFTKSFKEKFGISPSEYKVKKI